MTTPDMGVLANVMIAKVNSPEADKIITTFIDEKVDKVQTRTYQQLYQNANAIAAHLIEQGLNKGDSFGALLQNQPEMAECLIAASITGTVIVPIDPRTKGAKLAYILNDSGCKGIFCGDYNMANVADVASDTPLAWSVVVDGVAGQIADIPVPVCASSLFAEKVETVEVGDASALDVVQILYTSGTTGDPKGIVKVNQHLMTSGIIAEIVGLNETDVLYTGLSLTHANAQNLTLCVSLITGIPSVFSQRFTLSKLWHTIRRFNCTVFNLLGGMSMAIYSLPEQSNDTDNPVRLILSAGMPSIIWEKFTQRFNLKLFEAYGAAEGGIFWNDGSGPVGSMGNYINNPLFESRIVDKDNNDVEVGETGELIWRNRDGNPVVVSYLNNPKTSQKKVVDGWFRTGDIVHADSEGWLFFDYRAGGGIRRNGDFINPSFIEKTLAEIDGIKDVYVYGIPAKNGAPGEKDVVAALVSAEGKTVNPDDIYKVCREKLESNFVPSYLQFVNEIPKTASEKPQDRFLLDMFNEQSDSVFTEQR